MSNPNIINTRHGISSRLHGRDSSAPYLATSDTVLKSIVDHDHFPYTRFYRGEAISDRPIIMDREAGYRRERDECYAPVIPRDYLGKVTVIIFRKL